MNDLIGSKSGLRRRLIEQLQNHLLQHLGLFVASADGEEADAATAVNEDGRRQAGDAVRAVVARVGGDGEGVPDVYPALELSEELKLLRPRCGLPLGLSFELVDADDNEAAVFILLMQSVEARHRLDAVGAPRRPEVEEDDLALQLREFNGALSDKFGDSDFGRGRGLKPRDLGRRAEGLALTQDEFGRLTVEARRANGEGTCAHLLRDADALCAAATLDEHVRVVGARAEDGRVALDRSEE